MESTSREDLSALMDGELDAEPTRFLLRRLDHDPELSATWSRWHLIRACLAAEPARMSTRKCDDDFAARITAAVGGEHTPPTRRRRHWVQYVGGSALAAGVAVAALLLYGPYSAMEEPAPAAQQAASALASPAAASLAAAAPAKAPVTPPWLLRKRPSLRATQPAAAGVLYGTGLMQPDYLRRAAYTQGAASVPFAPPFGLLEGGRALPPFSIVPLPAPVSSAVAVPH